MRFFWKALLIGLGSYWLYKKSSSPSGDTEVQPRHAKENETTSQSPPGRSAAAKQGGVGVGSKRQESPSKTKKEEEVPTAQIIERLTEIDGVTSRVAENLVEKGIYSKEALTALSRDELMEIKGIGPKRAEKILTYDL